MGIITIAFDDGYADTYRYSAGILADHGIQATFAVPSKRIDDTLEGRPVMSVSQLLALRNTGHEIASHTRDHHNLLKLLNAEGETAVKYDMKASKMLLGESINTFIDSMVFPFINDNHNDLLLQLASLYYSSSRITSETPVFNDLPVKDPYSITGVALTTDHPVEEYNKMVDRVSAEDKWLIEVFHLVSDTNTKSAHRDEPYRFFMHVDDFKRHIEYIVSTGIPIMTQGQVIRAYSA